MGEIERRLAALEPSQEPRSFQSTLDGALNGRIGTAGVVPFDPLGAGAALNADRSQLQAMATEAAQANGLDPALFQSLISEESGWNPRAMSRAGAQGLAQLMPGTARGLGVSDAFDPRQNLMGGAQYLASLIQRFGSIRGALAAYNAGPNRVSSGSALPSETVSYVDRVMQLYEASRAR